MPVRSQRLYSVAPYVNELKVHFEPGHVDDRPGFEFTRALQKYFQHHKGRDVTTATSTQASGIPHFPTPLPPTPFRTEVLAASLTAPAEVLRLAGVEHITVSPPLLRELADTKTSAWAGPEIGAFFAERRDSDLEPLGTWEPKVPVETLLMDGSEWSLAFARADGGRCEGKLAQAIGIFADKQEAMEEIARKFMHA